MPSARHVSIRKLSAATPHKRCRFRVDGRGRTGPSARACTLSTREPAGRTGTGVQTAIVDLDGTMLDTLTDYTAAVNHALASQGMPARSVDEVRLATGNGIEHLMRESVPERTTRRTSSELRRLQDLYAAHNNDATPPLRRDARDGLSVARIRQSGARSSPTRPTLPYRHSRGSTSEASSTMPWGNGRHPEEASTRHVRL